MAWVPKPKEIEAMLAAEGKRRYEYFIHRVCDTRKIWGLYENGWATLGGGATKLIPFWPHQVYAERFKGEEWSAYEPKEIELSAFLDRWIPGMKRDGMGAAVFPVLSGSSVGVSLGDLEANIRHELAEYYEQEANKAHSLDGAERVCLQFGHHRRASSDAHRSNKKKLTPRR